MEYASPRDSGSDPGVQYFIHISITIPVEVPTDFLTTYGRYETVSEVKRLQIYNGYM